MGKTVALKPISQNAEKSAELEAWCRKQRFRQNTKALLSSTNAQFAEFTNQSLARKMTIIFDSMFGKGHDGGNDVDPETSTSSSSAEILMSSARGGAGLALDHGK